LDDISDDNDTHKDKDQDNGIFSGKYKIFMCFFCHFKAILCHFYLFFITLGAHTFPFFVPFPEQPKLPQTY